jgi:PRTRC genetic system ThiF family protein
MAKSQPITLDLDRLNAARLIVPLTTRVRLVLIGCGGTGSWLAPAVARISRLLIEKFAKEVAVGFVDPDTVEGKNIYRQNFCAAEIGVNKAVALATRYSLAWGVDIQAYPIKFGWSITNDLGSSLGNDNLSVYIGCVDNVRARRDILGAIRNAYGTCFWIDCGNVKESGQVLIGRNSPGEKVKTFSLPGRCAWLPLPSRQHKELIGRAGDGDDSEGDEENAEEGADGNEPGEIPVITDGLSCAEIAMLDEQGLSINQAIAAIAADYLLRLLLTQNLDKFQTYIDLASGSMKSTYITPANLRRWKRR